MNITKELVGMIMATVALLFASWFFIEQRIDEKVDKETFTIRLEMKQLRIDNVEVVLEEKLKIVKENQAQILEKLEVNNDK